MRWTLRAALRRPPKTEAMHPTYVPQAWLEAEASARQVTFGQWPVEQVRHLAGLDIFRAVCAGELPAPPLHEILNMLIVEVGPGLMVLQARPHPPHFNPLGTVHGGYIATLMDAATGCAAHTAAPAGKVCTTSNLHIHYVRAIHPRVPLLRVTGRVVHRGKRLATSEAQLVGPDGTLYAHASSTLVNLDRR